ncbi:MAG: cbb3-type cytochrome c oxidase subunit I [Planctomycetes bacterium]|nr:cbb3-type cytochrome c oxidase subunit I [Planctomycetota bacterium]
MSTSYQSSAEETAPAPENYLTSSRGIASWIFTLDHKRIGILYGVMILLSFAAAGFIALLIRTELLTPALDRAPSGDQYNAWFTLHGAIMVFMVIIPGVPAALGNFVLPLMLGAKDVAFPRLNLMSFYFWLGGAGFLLSTLFLAGSTKVYGVDTGWTLYPPHSIRTTQFASLALTGVFLLGFSSIFTGLNFIVTIQKLRPRAMTWFKMPLFLWAIYSTAVLQVMATPVLAITLLLLIVERTMGIGIFNPALGGDPVLFQHFFWFYSHPAVYIMILPAMGVVSELIAVHSHRHIFGYRFIAWSSVAIAMFSFIVWGHHMFTSTMSPLMNAIFSALTFSVSIPSAIKVFNWLATLYKASISITTPMLYGLAFIILFTIGGLTGLHLGTLQVDIHLHDTYFVVAHFHYVMMGSALMAMFGGLHHWWPKITGRTYSELLGQVSFWLIFIGFNTAFLPQFVMGSLGMPRRYASYPADAGFTGYHIASTIGAYIMAVGFVVMFVCFVQSLAAGRKAAANPWGGNSLEWHCAAPPPHTNFETVPEVIDCYDFHDWRYDAASGGFIKKTTAPGRVPA